MRRSEAYMKGGRTCPVRVYGTVLYLTPAERRQLDNVPDMVRDATPEEIAADDAYAAEVARRNAEDMAEMARVFEGMFR